MALFLVKWYSTRILGSCVPCASPTSIPSKHLQLHAQCIFYALVQPLHYTKVWDNKLDHGLPFDLGESLHLKTIFMCFFGFAIIALPRSINLVFVCITQKYTMYPIQTIRMQQKKLDHEITNYKYFSAIVCNRRLLYLSLEGQGRRQER